MLGAISAPLAGAGAVALGASAAIVKDKGLRPWLVGGAAVAAYLAWRSTGALLEQATDGGGALGVAGRLLGGEEKKGTLDSRLALPSELPQGTPRNLRRLRGRVLSPGDGTVVEVPLLASTYPVTIALANDGDAPVVSPVELQIDEDLFQASERIVTSPVSILPGAARVVTVRVPEVGTSLGLQTSVTLRVRFDGFLLATARFFRD